MESEEKIIYCSLILLFLFSGLYVSNILIKRYLTYKMYYNNNVG